MLMGLSMVSGLIGLWVCKSYFRWVILFVLVKGAWCVRVSCVCLLLLGSCRDLSVWVCDCDVKVVFVCVYSVLACMGAPLAEY